MLLTHFVLTHLGCEFEAEHNRQLLGVVIHQWVKIWKCDEQYSVSPSPTIWWALCRLIVSKKRN